MNLFNWKPRPQSAFAQLSPAQSAAVQERWRKISRRGLAFFLVTRTLVIFAWISICLAFFGHIGHTLHVMRQPFFLASVIPCMLVTSLALTCTQYFVTKTSAERISAQQPGV